LEYDGPREVLFEAKLTLKSVKSDVDDTHYMRRKIAVYRGYSQKFDAGGKASHVCQRAKASSYEKLSVSTNQRGDVLTGFAEIGKLPTRARWSRPSARVS
jgi:hypothetical protein